MILSETPSHVFSYWFKQTVIKNSSSGKNFSDIESKGWQQIINWYVNFYGLMLMMLFVWKTFTKPLNKLKDRTNIF